MARRSSYHEANAWGADRTDLASFRSEVLGEFAQLRNQIQSLKPDGNPQYYNLDTGPTLPKTPRNTHDRKRDAEQSLFSRVFGSGGRSPRYPSFGDHQAQDILGSELARLKDVEKSYREDQISWNAESVAERARYEVLATKLEAEKTQNSGLGKTIQSMKDDIGKREKEKKALKTSLEDQLRNMSKEKQRIIGQCEELEVKSKHLIVRVSEMTHENQVLQDQRSKLKNALLKQNKDSEKIDDSSIVTSFNDLRSQIQRIVFKFYDFKQQPRLDTHPTPRQASFFGLWGTGLSASELRNRARGVVFQLLSYEILSRPCFGLDGVQLGGELENGLASFEVLLSTIGPGHEADLSEWRMRTIKCAGLLPEFEQSDRARTIANKIWGFMLPVLSLENEDKIKCQDLQVQTRLITLCEDAFKLVLRIRGCNDLYKCEAPEEGDSINQDMEPQQTEKPPVSRTLIESPEVAYPLFGALVKYPADYPGERIVLEKAHVMVWK